MIRTSVIVILCFTTILLSCGAGVPAAMQAEVITEADNFSPQSESVPPEKPGQEFEASPGIDDQEIFPAYTPERSLTMHETIKAYFEQQYDAYTSMKYIDTSSIIDMEQEHNLNMARWTKTHILRRRLIYENKFCYVETEKFPYKITYEEKGEDGRMERWRRWIAQTKTTAVHFRITGTAGKAYPPLMAVNSQHTMFMKKIDGQWKIVLHYFPGSARKFTEVNSIKVPDRDAILKQLKLEFAKSSSPEPTEIPENATAYDAKKAVAYAKRHAEDNNPQFRHIGDWVGNCANYVSQCVWAGFGGGSHMTSQWNNYNGGTAAWLHVNSFWTYITSNSALNGQKLNGIRALEPGDIVQQRSLDVSGEDSRYTHMMILVDSDKLIFAQHTPSGFVYYSDLVNLHYRFIRPTYFVKSGD